MPDPAPEADAYERGGCGKTVTEYRYKYVTVPGTTAYYTYPATTAYQTAYITAPPVTVSKTAYVTQPPETVYKTVTDYETKTVTVYVKGYKGKGPDKDSKETADDGY